MIWLLVLGLAGWSFAFLAIRNGGETHSAMTYMSAPFGSLVIALIATWDGVGGVLYDILLVALPERGESINELPKR